jgi:hypothetical protein
MKPSSKSVIDYIISALARRPLVSLRLHQSLVLDYALTGNKSTLSRFIRAYNYLIMRALLRAAHNSLTERVYNRDQTRCVIDEIAK